MDSETNLGLEKCFTVEIDRKVGSDDKTASVPRQPLMAKGQGNAAPQQTVTSKGGPVIRQMSTGKDTAEKVSVKRLAVSREQC